MIQNDAYEPMADKAAGGGAESPVWEDLLLESYLYLDQGCPAGEFRPRPFSLARRASEAGVQQAAEKYAIRLRRALGRGSRMAARDRGGLGSWGAGTATERAVRARSARRRNYPPRLNVRGAGVRRGCSARVRGSDQTDADGDGRADLAAISRPRLCSAAPPPPRATRAASGWPRLMEGTGSAGAPHTVLSC